MNCNCEQNAVVIVRNNDSDFNGGKLATINLVTDILDLSNFTATLNMAGVIKTFEDLSSGSIEVNLTAEETKNLPPFFYGVLNLIDSAKKVATIESLIPFKVISQVHGNAIATVPYTLNFDVRQRGETILTVNVESAVSVEIGTTTTLPAGSNATVENVGTDNHLVLDFGIPQGIQGEQGRDAIITGATASVTNTVGIPSVTVTTGGTESARSFDFAFTNLKGDKGDKGDSGAVKDVQINSTSIVSNNGVANIQPATNGGDYGVVKLASDLSYFGLKANQNGLLYVVGATDTQITNKQGYNQPLLPNRIDLVASVSARSIYDRVKAISSGTVELDDGCVFYSDSPNADTTYTFTTTNLTQTTFPYRYFNVLITMPTTAVELDFTTNNNVVWTENETPDMSVGDRTYLLAFQTFDSGTNWVGSLCTWWENN